MCSGLLECGPIDSNASTVMLFRTLNHITVSFEVVQAWTYLLEESRQTPPATRIFKTVGVFRLTTVIMALAKLRHTRATAVVDSIFTRNQCSSNRAENEGYNMSRVMRKPDFCLCENKGADKLLSYCEADQRLCFRYTDSTILRLYKSKISSLESSSLRVQLVLRWT